MRKCQEIKIPGWKRLKSARTNWFLSSWKFSCLLVPVILLWKHRRFLCSDSNLISFFFPPPSSSYTCFKREPSAETLLFFIYLCPQVFQSNIITKQTNKFRACAADTNIDMSYEIWRSWERLWPQIHNICTGQEQSIRPERPAVRSPSRLVSVGRGRKGG